MAEEVFFYSSAMLGLMACLTLGLCIYIRLQYNKIKRLPKDLLANAFNKTFIVFNPYSEHIQVIHNFVSWLPILILFATLGFTIVVLMIMEHGLLLSLIILVGCLNLIIVEALPETLKNAKIFLKAYGCGTNLGMGDLQVLNLIRHALPKLANYYLGLTAFFAVIAVSLSYCWEIALLFLSQFVGLLVEGSTLFGARMGWQVAVFFYAIVLTAFQFFIVMMKKRFLRYIFGQPN
jgi:hypothetical protein